MIAIMDTSYSASNRIGALQGVQGRYLFVGVAAIAATIGVAVGGRQLGATAVSADDGAQSSTSVRLGAGAVAGVGADNRGTWARCRRLALLRGQRILWRARHTVGLEPAALAGVRAGRRAVCARRADRRVAVAPDAASSSRRLKEIRRVSALGHDVNSLHSATKRSRRASPPTNCSGRPRASPMQIAVPRIAHDHGRIMLEWHRTHLLPLRPQG